MLSDGRRLVRSAWRDPQMRGFLLAQLALYAGAFLIVVAWSLGLLGEPPSDPPAAAEHALER